MRGCQIAKAGASGVCFVGDPQAARNPLFNYSQVNKLEDLDRTPGPRTKNYPADCIVDNCLIYLLSKLIMAGIKKNVPALARFVVDDFKEMDPAHPEPAPEYLQQSPGPGVPRRGPRPRSDRAVGSRQRRALPRSPLSNQHPVKH